MEGPDIRKSSRPKEKDGEMVGQELRAVDEDSQREGQKENSRISQAEEKL